MKKTKKNFASITLSLILATTLNACNGSHESGFVPSKEIGVISREEGSGTHGAFIELFGILQKNEKGEKMDYTSETSAITNSTSVMMTTVAGDLYSIGYISTGSLNDTVKPLSIDGSTPTIDNIKNGSYRISRPFNIITREDISDAAKDFVSFILSEDGKNVIEENGYIANSNSSSYQTSTNSGKIVISGSSSVTPVIEKLKEAYNQKNPGIDIEIQQSDSSTGISDVIDGTCDIGMSSRELKDQEVNSGITATSIAVDGIAVIVNKENPIEELTGEQIKKIFTGDIETWDVLSN